MSLQQFINATKGKQLIRNGLLGINAAGAQCVNIANDLLTKLGLPNVHGNATAFAHSLPGVPFVAFTGRNTGHPGDLVVWKPNYAPLNIGSAGHIGVFIRRVKGGFISEDVNWNGSKTAQLVFHSWADVAGFLRTSTKLKGGKSSTPPASWIDQHKLLLLGGAGAIVLLLLVAK